MAKDKGNWITLHRKLMKWEWYTDSQMLHLFIHLLLLANHEDGNWKGNLVKRGQLITGIYSLSKDTGISIQSLRTCLKRLKSTHELTIKSTNQFSLITLLKYSDYQDRVTKLTSKLTSKLTNEQQTTNKRLTTNNNNKQINNNNKPLATKVAKQENDSFQKEYLALVEIFKEINPNYKNLYKNKTERKSFDELKNQFKLEDIMAGAEYAISIRDQQYAPFVNTPYLLLTKWGQLMKYKFK